MPRGNCSNRNRRQWNWYGESIAPAAVSRSSGARWLRLAAYKWQRSAQAMFGSMLFKGQGVARQPAVGLAWLMLAKDGASSQEAWITETYRSALAQAV